MSGLTEQLKKCKKCEELKNESEFNYGGSIEDCLYCICAFTIEYPDRPFIEVLHNFQRRNHETITVDR